MKEYKKFATPKPHPYPKKKSAWWPLPSPNQTDPDSIPGSGRSPGEGILNPLQYSGLENSMDTVHGVPKSRTWLSDFHFQYEAVYPSNNSNFPYPVPGNQHSTLFLYEFDCFRYFIQIDLHSTCLFVTGLFHLISWPRGSSMHKDMQDFRPFPACIIFPWVHTLHCVYPFTHCWTFVSLPLLGSIS